MTTPLKNPGYAPECYHVICKTIETSATAFSGLSGFDFEKNDINEPQRK